VSPEPIRDQEFFLGLVTLTELDVNASEQQVGGEGKRILPQSARQAEIGGRRSAPR